MRALCTALLMAAATAMGSAKAFAAAKDYRFELIGAPTMTGKAAHVTVRLIHVPDGKAVPDAEITDVKFDMGPAGMAGMAAPAKAMPAKEPGSYMIETQPSMAGSWGLTLTAKVKSEAETVRGTVVVTVPK
ncbi:MAG: FixH family protein [Rhodospirillaceae bacterium]